jgi:hypothetical protein
MNIKTEKIVDPVSKELIRSELTKERLLRTTNKADNEIYVINNNNSPNVVREIGRLREISFRLSGGGTGKEIDVDNFDICDNPYDQLIVWDPSEQEIVGGYRFKVCSMVCKGASEINALATSSMFRFSQKFIDEFLPYTIELGRSFVQPAFQPSHGNRKSIFALDNLWDGLGALIVDYSNTRHFFGKVTMYKQFNQQAKDIILFFFKKFFPDHENLVEPFEPVLIQTPFEKLESMFTATNIEDNYKVLVQEVRNLKENIPPLINSYVNLCYKMISFGTAINKNFGGVEETGILVSYNDILQSKRERYCQTYIDWKAL